MALYLRDARASYDSRYLCASQEREQITIWKTDPPAVVTTVNPGFSDGRLRHAIDPINRVIYAGLWEDGLTAYDFESKRVLWRRTDLIGIQTVDLSAGFPRSVYVTLEAPDYRVDEPGVESGIAELDAQTGEMGWVSDKGDWLFLDPLRPIIVMQDRYKKVVRILDEQKRQIGKVPMINFAIIDAAFADGMIALAEGAKGVRVIDHHGKTISHHVPSGRKPNCIGITFDQGRVCVEDSWEGTFITILDPHTGEVLSEYERPSHDRVCFIDHGSRYVTSRGTIFRSSDGVKLGSFDPNPGEDTSEEADLRPILPPGFEGSEQ